MSIVTVFDAVLGAAMEVILEHLPLLAVGVDEVADLHVLLHRPFLVDDVRPQAVQITFANLLRSSV